MAIHDPQFRAVKELLAGVRTRTFWGDNLMFSLVELDAHAVIPTHSHPHEQGTYLLSGGFEATVGNETRWVSPGQLFIVPGGVGHSVRVGHEMTRLVDVFTPLREDLKY
jgi:quercetin dioxygenase-like cupin family protein